MEVITFTLDQLEKKGKGLTEKKLDVAHQMQELGKSVSKKIIGNLRSNESGQ